MAEKRKNYASFCESKKCTEFIRWDCGFGVCESCKLIGQSETVSEYPENCLFINEITQSNSNN